MKIQPLVVCCHNTLLSYSPATVMIASLNIYGKKMQNRNCMAGKQSGSNGLFFSS
jgi:hypothetical protein